MNRTLLIVIACLAGILLTAGWLLKNQIASNTTLKDQLSQSQQILLKYESQQKSVEAVDQHYQQVLNDAKAENDRLAESIRVGTVRLRVNAKCLPVTATTSGSSDGSSTAELDRNTTESIVALTQRGDAAIRQLTGLQEYVKTTCLISP